MSKFFTLIAVVAVVIVGATGAVAAQEQGGSNMTMTPTAGEDEETGSTATIELSSTTKITKWRFENGTFYVTFKTERPTGVAITDAGKLAQILSEGDGAKAGKARVRRVGLTRGTTTVEFRAEEYGGASAITITSSNANGVVAIRSDAISPAKDAIEWSSAGLLIVGSAVGAGYYSYRKMKKRLEEMKQEVERII